MALRIDPRGSSPDNAPDSGEGEGVFFSTAPQYDPAYVESLFSVRRWKHPKSANKFLVRFFSVLWFFLKILYHAWSDRQIWTYVGVEDIDLAQSKRRRKHARWLTEKLLGYGPTFIKVGQSVSTRVDLIRKEYIEELSKLQDRVPPFPIEQVRRILTEELGAPPEEVFEAFNPTPIAAASLGQVHRARLKSGQEIVLKVQRPNLLETFNLDLAIMRKIARFLQTNTDLGRGREWVQIVDEFGRTLFEEIDYIQEGRNADIFRKNFRRSANESAYHVHIPEIHWRYTSRRVLAMEYAPGVKVNDIRSLELADFDREALAISVVKAYFQQILVDGFYHADPHPGNIAVREDGAIIFYDFGMVGKLSEKNRVGIVDTFLNIINKKPDHILNNLIDLDMLAPNADLDVIRQVIVWSLDNYYDVPHDQLNFEHLTEEMSELMYAHPFKLPANFTFMIRALLTLEGVATTLDPGIQFMNCAVEYARQFLGQTLNLDFIVKKGMDILGVGAEKAFGPSARRQPRRVRLEYDEWTPLARYIKAGFLLLGFGQILIFILFTAFLGAFTEPHPQFTLWSFVAVSFFLACYGLLLMSVLILMPARKKPVRFEPMPSTSSKKGGK